jgi:hypothetical protein
LTACGKEKKQIRKKENRPKKNKADHHPFTINNTAAQPLRHAETARIKVVTTAAWAARGKTNAGTGRIFDTPQTKQHTQTYFTKHQLICLPVSLT